MKNTPGFTPGPWKVWGEANRGAWWIENKQGASIASVQVERDLFGENAALIAAAPSLYAALEVLVFQFHDDPDPPVGYAEGLAALKSVDTARPHDPLCSEGTRAGDQVMPCDCRRSKW
jgi:hypothetical protein